MKIKNFFSDFEVNPISANPLHGVISKEVMAELRRINEEKRLQSINQLGGKWLVHPSNQVQRKEAA